MAYAPNNPNDPRLTDPNRPLLRRDRGPGGWAWVVIIIAIVLILWIVLGGRGHLNRTMAGTRSGSGQAQQDTSTITDPGQLTSSSAKDLVGHPVQIAAAQVDHSANAGAFLIDSNGTPVLVVLSNAANAENPGTSQRPTETNGGVWKKDHPATEGQVRNNGAGQLADKGKGTPESAGNAAPLGQEHSSAFQKGDTVSIQGTVRDMPSEHDAMTRFNLSTDESARASKAKVYIEASSVQPAAK